MVEAEADEDKSWLADDDEESWLTEDEESWLAELEFEELLLPLLLFDA